MDRIAQEVDETFLIVFTNLNLNNADLFPETPHAVFNTLNGIILDSDRKLKCSSFSSYVDSMHWLYLDPCRY